MADINEKDDFWDLSKLVPKKKKIPPFAAQTKVADFSADGDLKNNDGNSERKLTFEGRGAQAEKIPDTEYFPNDSGLIKRVTIKRSLDRFDFYGNFRKAAMVYFDFKMQKCDFVSFFSYMPQYSQLKPEQKNYYFYWREELRQGRYIKSDYSYISLYVYEILNLPDLIPPAEGIKLLCSVWREYRAALPRLDLSFASWVQDYCLVHKLPCPTELIEDFIYEIIELSGFREFYISAIITSAPDKMSLLASYLSDYDWRRGKYAQEEDGGFYANHMNKALGRLMSAVWLSREDEYSIAEAAVLTKYAFPKSLCTHSVKCTLEVEYYPISALKNLREAITWAVKYAENKLRAILGIKSRLGIKNIDPYHKHIIDRYFDAICMAEAQRRRVAELPEYEKQYDAPSEGISTADADEIERLSWQNTRLLVSEEELAEDISAPENIHEPNREEATPAAPAEEALFGLSSLDIGFIKALLSSGEAPETLENSAFAERINEAFSEGFGDIIIENTNGKYTLIEDYKEDTERLLKGR